MLGSNWIGANSVGVATVGGETTFHPCYRGNILVNAFNLGLVEVDKIFLASASGVGNPVIYVGSRRNVPYHLHRSGKHLTQLENRRPSHCVN